MSHYFGVTIGNKFLQIDDNAHPQRAALMTDYLEGEIIKQME